MDPAMATAATVELLQRTAELTLIARNDSSNSTSSSSSVTGSSSVFTAVGISLAVASGLFIGVSFVLKKMGLLKANEKYHEEAGEGYGYLKNAYWWSGMTLMILGEICNFVAYAFVDAILVTPLGALSVVITTILSAIFLKERLSMIGKVGCFLCIVGSVIIPLNAPGEQSAATIQDMQHFVVAPGFLSYAGVIILGCVFTALWAGPRYGKKSMMVYLTICSNIGGLSVVATQGLGAAIVTQIGGTNQFNQWFLYVLLVFVIVTLVTEIIYLNKALNLFNAALVTPTYYVYFTSCTIITSAVLFQGFSGPVQSIVTVVLGFFVICAGVVLLQLSKSAKDVPDAAVFSGDLDQVRTIAEQEQPETEPKADAIRGTAAIVRRLSTVRQKKERDEARRLHEEKQMDLQPIGEDETVYWDGLRRRRTTVGSRSSGWTAPRTPRTPHPPLGMSQFPAYDENHHDEESHFASSIMGSIRSRAQTLQVPEQLRHLGGAAQPAVQSPMHPVPLTEIALPYKEADHPYGGDTDTAYAGARSEPHIRFADGVSDGQSSLAPTPPPHSAKRQFSFTNVFRKSTTPAPVDEQSPPKSRQGRPRFHSNAKADTEEERLGLVRGDGKALPRIPSYETPYESDDDDYSSDGQSKKYTATATSSPERHGRGITESPERTRTDSKSSADSDHERQTYEQHRRKWSSRGNTPPREPPTPKDGEGRGGSSFI